MRTRTSPRISITKLAEYLVATAGRRRSIVRDQKFPPAFKAAKFREAYTAIAEILEGGCEVGAIDVRIETWRRRAPTSAFHAECLALCIEALSAFKVVIQTGVFDEFSFAPGITEAYVELGGVDLSVRPEVLLEPEIGAMKIYLGKTTPLTGDARGRPGSSSYAAAALHLWVEDQFGSVQPERCLVVDVFAGRVYRAPARNVSRRADLLAACEEIATVWASINAPTAPPPVITP